MYMCSKFWFFFSPEGLTEHVLSIRSYLKRVGLTCTFNKTLRYYLPLQKHFTVGFTMKILWRCQKGSLRLDCSLSAGSFPQASWIKRRAEISEKQASTSPLGFWAHSSPPEPSTESTWLVSFCHPALSSDKSGHLTPRIWGFFGGGGGGLPCCCFVCFLFFIIFSCIWHILV